MAILFFKPVFKQRIWGGQYFKDVLKYNLDDDNYGELWSLSAHPQGETIITNGDYIGKTLSQLYKEKPELFNSNYKEFPLMVKLLSTNDLLSVQVHPDDHFAARVENQYGKTECWYFLDSKIDSSIVMGHTAQTKEDMAKAIAEGKCESLLSYRKVNKGDFVLIPSKTVHALGKHLLLLEIQQSSDITYRLYDYDRKDKNGNKRELHVEKALQVIDFPQKVFPEITHHQNNVPLETLTDCDYFKVEKLTFDGSIAYKFKENTFHIFSIGEGSITVNDGTTTKTIPMGESFLTTADEYSIILNGKATVLISSPKNK